MAEQLSKSRILAASIGKLQLDGLTDWSIEKCAKEARCAKGLVLHHFGSKDELLRASAHSIVSDRADRWRAALTAEGIEGLDALWEVMAAEVGDRRARALLELRLAGVDGARLTPDAANDLRTALARTLSTRASELPPAAALEGILEGYQLAMMGSGDREGVREAFFRYWLTFVE